MITAQVVHEIMRSSIISEVASTVERVTQAEVLVADSIDVFRVTDVCDVDLAPIYQLL